MLLYSTDNKNKMQIWRRSLRKGSKLGELKMNLKTCSSKLFNYQAVN